MIKENRLKRVKLRKNFFPTLSVIFAFLGLIILIVYFVDPNTFAIIPVFFLLIFFTLLLIASTLFANTRRGFIVSLCLTSFLLLIYLGVGNVLNLLLILGLAVAAEIYFSRDWRSLSEHGDWNFPLYWEKIAFGDRLRCLTHSSPSTKARCILRCAIKHIDT